MTWTRRYRFRIGSVAAALRGRCPPITARFSTPGQPRGPLLSMGGWVTMALVQTTAGLINDLRTVCKFSRLRAGKPPGGGSERLVGRPFFRYVHRSSDTVIRGRPSLLGARPNQRDDPASRFSSKKPRQRSGATWSGTSQGGHPYGVRWFPPTSSATGREAAGPSAVSRRLGGHGVVGSGCGAVEVPVKPWYALRRKRKA